MIVMVMGLGMRVTPSELLQRSFRSDVAARWGGGNLL